MRFINRTVYPTATSAYILNETREHFILPVHILEFRTYCPHPVETSEYFIQGGLIASNHRFTCFNRLRQG